MQHRLLPLRSATAIVLALTLAGCATTAAAPSPDQIAGLYAVTGKNFDGAPYTGDVVVQKTGATYKVIWYPGANQIEGVGIYQNGQLSVGYLQEGVQGVAVYEPAGGGLKGVWAEIGRTAIAPEDWTRK
jgi:hypothetical protein